MVTDPPSPQRIRIVDGALACVARQGVAKTTVEDVAREAGLSRATVYRAFPDGKDSLLAAVVDTEVARLFSALGARMGESSDLSDVLVGGIVEAATRLRSEHWMPIEAMAESALRSGRRELVLEVFREADRPGFHQEHLRRRCRTLTGVGISDEKRVPPPRLRVVGSPGGGRS